jgi:hypothetical protein
MARANLGALGTLSDNAMALEVDGDFVAFAMQVLGVGRTRPEYGVEYGGAAPMLARDRQAEFRNRPAFALLHVLGLDVVNVHEGILERHGYPYVCALVVDAGTSSIPAQT